MVGAPRDGKMKDTLDWSPGKVEGGGQERQKPRVEVPSTWRGVGQSSDWGPLRVYELSPSG